MNTVTDKTHARLGPSGWDWWSNCPGAPALCTGQPRTTSKYAAEGTAAHEVADLCLKGILPKNGGQVGDPHNYIGQMFSVDGYDILVDQEMAEAVGTYINACFEFVGKGGTLMPEQQVPIGHLTGEPGAEGTSDCIGITADGKRLIVIDLKYGKGVAVDAKDNGQGRIYALGALHKFGMVYDDIEEVEIVIIQPRLDSVSSEILTVAHLRQFGATVEIAAGMARLEDAVWAEEPGNAKRLTLTPGEKQCRFCAAKGFCPALRDDVSQSLAVISGPSGPDDFADLTLPKQAAAALVTAEVDVERLAEFMRAVPLIEEAIKGVRAEVERRLFDGQAVPGFYLGVGRRGNRKWGVADIEEQLKKRLGVAGTYEKKVISVATAEKLFKDKPRTWNKIKDLVVQDEGKPSVCKDGDKNPVYTPPGLVEDFVDLIQTDGSGMLQPHNDWGGPNGQSEADALLG